LGTLCDYLEELHIIFILYASFLNYHAITLAIDNLNYAEIIHSILELDKSITTATIASLESGRVLATNCSEEYAALPVLKREEFERLTIRFLFL
jgi:hypothetical protein